MIIPKPLINILKVLFTILFLFLVFQSIDISKISNDLKSFSLGLLSALLVGCWMAAAFAPWLIFKGEGFYRPVMQSGGRVIFAQCSCGAAASERRIS
jgi:hypothetical protein